MDQLEITYFQSCVFIRYLLSAGIFKYLQNKSFDTISMLTSKLCCYQ